MKGGNIIYTKFLNLEPEKQERILNAAMKEFAQKGYMNASTELIVKDAGISKGALFYYFKNKRGLFLYLYDYSLEILRNEIFMKLDHKERDLFVRIKEMALVKIEILKKHPEIYNFVGGAYLDDAMDVHHELVSRNEALIANSIKVLYEGIDTSKFKEGIDVERIISIVRWTMDGFTNQEAERIKREGISMQDLNYDQMIEKMDAYLEVLKNSFYK